MNEKELKSRLDAELSNITWSVRDSNAVRQQVNQGGTFMKKKQSISFIGVIALLLALAAVAYAATEVFNRISVNWKGEVISEEQIIPKPTAEIPVSEDELKQIAERLVASAKDGEIVVSSYLTPDGGHSGYRRNIYKETASFDELQNAFSGKNSLTLPTWIPDGYQLQSAQLSFVSKDSYVLIEEKQEGSVTLKRYTVDDANVIIDSYDLTFMNDQNHMIMVSCTLNGAMNADTDAINMTDGESVEAITVPGMDNALAIHSENSTVSILRMRRVLDNPLEWKDLPDRPQYTMTYAEENIFVWSSDLDMEALQKMFTPE